MAGVGSVRHLVLYYRLIPNCNAKDGIGSASSLVRDKHVLKVQRVSIIGVIDRSSLVVYWVVLFVKRQ